MPPEIERVTGEYVLQGAIGRGGSGCVFRGHHRDRPTHPVAIKLITGPPTPDDPERRRFLREMAILSNLTHPDIVKFVDWGRDYLVMEYCPWRSLRDRIVEGPISTPEAVRIARRIAGVLDYLHERGVYHRDLKPENILVNGEEIKVVDFGVSTEPALLETQPGLFVGTLVYAPPEELDGTPGGADGGSRDAYALGVVLFEMVTGQTPFRVPGAPLDLGTLVSLKAAAEALDPGDQFTARLRALVRGLSARDPTVRLSSVHDAQTELRSEGLWPDANATERIADIVLPAAHKNALAETRVRLVLVAFGGTMGALLAVARFWPAVGDPVGVDSPVPATAIVAATHSATQELYIPPTVQELFPSCADLHMSYPDASAPSPDSSMETWRLFCAGLVFRAKNSGSGGGTADVGPDLPTPTGD